MSDHVIYESRVELARLLMADFDQSVNCIVAQPFACHERHDRMLKYATAIRVGTASTEAILRRFMKANATHPTYQAMIRLGRAQKTTFLARIPGHSRGLNRRTHRSRFGVGEGCGQAGEQQIEEAVEFGGAVVGG